MKSKFYPVVILFLVLFFNPMIFSNSGENRRQTEIQGPQAPPYVPTKPIVIRGGLLIDGTGASPRHDQAVIIEGEKITWVGPMEEMRIPEGAQVIDAEGMTVMPGLIDSNCHVNLNPLYSSSAANLPLETLKARWENNWSRMPYRAFVYLMQGVTSMRNTSGPFKRIIPIKHAIDKGEIPGPRLFLGGALLMSDEHFEFYTTENNTPTDAMDWLRNEFAYHVIEDVDKDTDVLLSDDFNFWKLYMSDDTWNGTNDFTDEELRFMIDKAHEHGKIVDCRTGGFSGRKNEALRRMLPFDMDTLEHPFYPHFIVDMDIIEGYVKKGVYVASQLTGSVIGGQLAADPHRLSETLYTMSLDPQEHRLLMQYRDQWVVGLRRPDEKIGVRSFKYKWKRRQTARENMRRFIKAGAKLFLGTDTPSMFNFQQENPDASELKYMVEMGLTPMQAILAATRNGAEALGKIDELGTIETGKLADVIIVPGNPLLNMEVMKRIYVVIKGGVRYK